MDALLDGLDELQSTLRTGTQPVWLASLGTGSGSPANPIAVLIQTSRLNDWAILTTLITRLSHRVAAVSAAAVSAAANRSAAGDDAVAYDPAAVVADSKSNAVATAATTSTVAASASSAVSDDMHLIVHFHAIHFLLKRAPPPASLAVAAGGAAGDKAEAAAHALIVDLVVRICLPLLASRHYTLHHFVRTLLVLVTSDHTSSVGLLVTDVCLHAIRAAVPAPIASPASPAAAASNAIKAMDVSAANSGGSGGGGGIAVDADMRVICQLSVDLLNAKFDATLQSAFRGALFDAAVSVLTTSVNIAARRYIISTVLPAFCLHTTASSSAAAAAAAASAVQTVYDYVERAWMALPDTARTLAAPALLTAAIVNSASHRTGPAAAATAPVSAPPALATATSVTSSTGGVSDERRMGELYGLVCQYYHVFQTVLGDSGGGVSRFDDLVTRMALVGLESENGLIAKQSAYLVRLRMQTNAPITAAAVGDSKSPPAAAVQLLTASHPHRPGQAVSSAAAGTGTGYSTEQWDAFLTLFEAMQEHARHLIQSVWPKLQLFVPARGMDEWLLLIFRRGFAHSNNTVKKFVMEETEKLFAATTPANAAPTLMALKRELLLTAVLPYLNTPTLYSIYDKTANIGPRVTRLFLLFISSLPNHPIHANGESARTTFVRDYVHSVATITTSVYALTPQLDVLVQLPAGSLPAGVFTDSALAPATMWDAFLLFSSTLRISPRFQRTIQCRLIEGFFRHVELSRTALASIAQLLDTQPRDLFAPNEPLTALIQTAVYASGGADSKDGAWLPKQLLASLDEYLNPKPAVGAGASEAIVIDAISTRADQLARMFLLTRESSSEEEAFISKLTNVLRGLYSQPYLARGVAERCVILLYRILSDTAYFRFDVRPTSGSNPKPLFAARHSSLIAVLTAYGHELTAYLDGLAATTFAGAGSATTSAGSESGVSIDDKKLRYRGVTGSLLHLLFARYAVPSIAAYQTKLLTRSVTAVIRQLKSQAKPDAKSSSADPAPAQIPASERLTTVTTLHALIRAMANSAATAAAAVSSDAKSGGGARAVVRSIASDDVGSKYDDAPTLRRETDEHARILASAAAARGATGSDVAAGEWTDAMIVRFLIRVLPELELKRSTAAAAAGSGGGKEWMTVLEEYNKHLWHTMRHLFRFNQTMHHRQSSAAPSSLQPLSLSLTRSLLDRLIDAADTCTPPYTASVFRCLSDIMPRVIRHSWATSGSAAALRTVSDVFAVCWRAYSDARKSGAVRRAFLSLLFNGEWFPLLELHNTSKAPLKLYVRKLLEQSVGQAELGRELLCSCIAAWNAFPQTLPYYVPEIVEFCIFHVPAADDAASAKLGAHRVIHMLHMYTISEVPRIALSAAVYEETVVRLMMLRFLEHFGHTALLARATNPNGGGNAFLTELISYMLTINAKELKKIDIDGSPLFIKKAYLWQSLCVLSRFLLAASDQAALIDRLNTQVWPAFECGNSSTLRHLMEVFLISYLSQYPRFITSHLIPRMLHPELRPTLLASDVVIISYALLYSTSDYQTDYYEPVSNALYPLLASNYGHVRMSAQYFFHRVLLTCAPHILRASPSTTFDVDAALNDRTGAVARTAAGTSATASAAATAAESVLNDLSARVQTRVHPLKQPAPTAASESGGPTIIDTQNRSQKSVNPAKRKADKKAIRAERDKLLAEQALRRAEHEESERLSNAPNAAAVALTRKQNGGKPFVAMLPATATPLIDSKQNAGAGGVSLPHDNESCLASMFYYLDTQMYANALPELCDSL